MSNNKYSIERYYWLKEHHICVSCGCEEAEKNSIYCLICKEDKKVNQLNKYHEKARNGQYRKKEAERKRKAYYKAKAEHKCTKCGKELPKNKTTVLCTECYRKQANNYKPKDGYTRGERPNYGRCYICGKHELYSNSLCKKCYQRLQETNRRTQINPTPAMIRARKEYSNYFKIIFKFNQNRKEKNYV